MPLFLETATDTAPGPVPADPADMTAQDTGLVAVQVQPVPSVTPTETDVAGDAIESAFADSA